MTAPARTTHTILTRQLDRLGLSAEKLPVDEVVWKELLVAVQSYYEFLEMNTNKLESTLRESAQRMRILEESVGELQGQIALQSQEHYQNVFERTPIPTWEENFTHAAVWLEDLRMSGVEDLEQHLRHNQADLKTAVSLIEVSNVNLAAAKLVGATDEAALLGPLDPDLVDDESAESFIAQLKGIWDSLDSVRTSLVGRTFTGGTFDAILEWNAPRVFGSPDYSRVLVTIVDITEQKEAEREAEARLKSKDEMIANVTHELRTPLTSVLGFAELLRSMDDEDYSEERDALLGVISSQATDLSALVEDLLTTARSELGQLTVASVPVNVHAQIAQVMEGRGEDDREIKVQPRPADPLVATGDPQRVRQILRNLITNSERYGGPDTAIVVDSSQNEIAVRVLDNGDGLDPKMAGTVFDRFVRKSGNEANPGSVGLGLAIARDLARRMEGDLTYSRVGGWTCFALTLPLHVEEEEASSAEET